MKAKNLSFKKSLRAGSFLAICAAMIFAGCASSPLNEENHTETLPKIDMSKWLYNAEDDVYYQTGLSYAASPADEKYETLGIFVPGAFFTAEKSGTDAAGNETYSVRVNETAKAGDFTAGDAPFVMPIQTPGYAALEPPKSYTHSAAGYTKNGFIFVYAGARGKDHGAPAGVTDFKAAIRYVRYNKNLLPGDTKSYFTYGMSGGGAQSAVIGASGDSKEYEPYLKAIGAVMDESDAVLGSQDWCPITNLNVADEAYEWELGAARKNLDSETESLSKAMAVKFAEYLNSLNLKDEDGNSLSLSQSVDGLYHAGTYYEYLKKTIETSLNNFLSDTKFPYNPEEQKAALGSNMMPAGNSFPRLPEPSAVKIEDLDGVMRGEAQGGQLSLSGTYASAEDYISALNQNENWVLYDKDSNTAEITSAEAFMRNVKQLQKNVGAFDDLSGNQPENVLFGLGDGNGGHFDKIMAEILKGTEKGDEYSSSIARNDSLGFDVSYRMNLYNPMYFLSPAYGGFKKSTPAKYWRINAGIFQGDTAVSTELLYYLALKNYGSGVEDVKFFDVWGLHHVEAERASLGDGTSTGNFIAWVKECLE